MNFDHTAALAKTLLYEGYVLYPYQPDAIKNRQRWTFGAVLPPDFVATQTGSSDQSFVLTECLLQGDTHTKINVVIRFLHLIDRTLRVEGHRYHTWQEASEREIVIQEQSLADIEKREVVFPFCFEASQIAVNDQISRHQALVQGKTTLSISKLQCDIYRLSVRVENTSFFEITDLKNSKLRDLALKRALVSAHTLIGVEGGSLISLLDPPEKLKIFSEGCKNIGTFPVLAGNPDSNDVMLSSPIILYDYPQIAPESGGDFFDGTEIDETLSLRIQTLTDAEKDQMRLVDEHTRSLLERTESSRPKTIDSLQGRRRFDTNQKVDAVIVRGTTLQKGSRVRLRLEKFSDIFDTVLNGMTAVIESIEQDFEDRIFLAVTMEDDPGCDLGALGKPGHRFFFKPNEVEPL